MRSPLTRKQHAFVAEYLVDLNGAQAAIRSGYSPRTATEQAYVLLRLPDVAAAIERAMAERASRTRVGQDTVISEMAQLAFSCITHYVIDEDTGDLKLKDGAPLGAMSAVQSVKHRKRVCEERDGSIVTTRDTEIRLWAKPKALFMLARHLGMFAERGGQTGPKAGPTETVPRVEPVFVSLPPITGNTKHERAIPAPDERSDTRCEGL